MPSSSDKISGKFLEKSSPRMLYFPQDKVSLEKILMLEVLQ